MAPRSKASKKAAVQAQVVVPANAKQSIEDVVKTWPRRPPFASDTLEMIGEGGHATVYIYTSANGNQGVVKMGNSEAQAEAIEREAKLLETLRHKNILQVLAWHKGLPIFQFCSDGDLMTRIEKRALVSEERLFSWAAQIASALDYLHSTPILHRDIKPENIFVKKQDAILGDFGISFEGVQAVELTGTEHYWPPEVMSENLWTAAADVWAFGKTFVKLFHSGSGGKGVDPMAQDVLFTCLEDQPGRRAAAKAVRGTFKRLAEEKTNAQQGKTEVEENQEAGLAAKISAMSLEIGDIQKAVKSHDSWMESISNTLRQMQEKDEQLGQRIESLESDLEKKLEAKVNLIAWQEANNGLDAGIKSVHCKADERFASLLQNITAVEARWKDQEASHAEDMGKLKNDITSKLDIQSDSIWKKVLKNHDSQMADISNTLRQMQEKDEQLGQHIASLESELETKSVAWQEAHDSRFEDISKTLRQMQEKDGHLDQEMKMKVDSIVWTEANHDLTAAVQSVHKLVATLNLDLNTWHDKVNADLDGLRLIVDAQQQQQRQKAARPFFHRVFQALDEAPCLPSQWPTGRRRSKGGA